MKQKKKRLKSKAWIPVFPGQNQQPINDPLSLRVARNPATVSQLWTKWMRDNPPSNGWRNNDVVVNQFDHIEQPKNLFQLRVGNVRRRSESQHDCFSVRSQMTLADLESRLKSHFWVWNETLQTNSMKLKDSQESDHEASYNFQFKTLEGTKYQCGLTRHGYPLNDNGDQIVAVWITHSGNIAEHSLHRGICMLLNLTGCNCCYANAGLFYRRPASSGAASIVQTNVKAPPPEVLNIGAASAASSNSIPPKAPPVKSSAPPAAIPLGKKALPPPPPGPQNISAASGSITQLTPPEGTPDPKQQPRTDYSKFPGGYSAVPKQIATVLSPAQQTSADTARLLTPQPAELPLSTSHGSYDQPGGIDTRHLHGRGGQSGGTGGIDIGTSHLPTTSAELSPQTNPPAATTPKVAQQPAALTPPGTSGSMAKEKGETPGNDDERSASESYQRHGPPSKASMTKPSDDEPIYVPVAKADDDETWNVDGNNLTWDPYGPPALGSIWHPPWKMFSFLI